MTERWGVGKSVFCLAFLILLTPVILGAEAAKTQKLAVFVDSGPQAKAAAGRKHDEC